MATSPYIVTLTDGNTFATISTGTVNQSSSMTLIGKNYAEYGQMLADNFIRLLENASNTTAPPAPLTGQLWWDKTTTLLKVYSSTTGWKNIGGATASSSQPTPSIVGDLWFNTVNQQLNICSVAGNPGTFIVVGAAVNNPGNITFAVANTVVSTVASTGSFVTGLISATGNVSGANILISGLATVAGNIQGGNLTTAGLVSAAGTVTGSSLIGSVVNASGNVTGGNVLTSGLLSAVGTITGSSLLGSVVSASGNVISGNVVTVGLATVTGNIQGGNLITVGLISAGGTIAGSQFAGSGAGLTSIPGGNVSGTVANATYATSAGSAATATTANSANSVAGANVTGAVANATYATSAGSATTANSATVANSANSVSGANVSGAVANATYATSAGAATTATTATFAGTANAVAGANVTGTVSNATTAGTANAVTGANVTGTVANATYAVSAGSATTAGTAYAVSAANVSGKVANATYSDSAGAATTAGSATTATTATTATYVTGLTSSNVTTALTYTPYNSTNPSGYQTISGSVNTANSATTAGTVTTAAQSNITSVGTLTSLTVSGTTNLGSVSSITITGGTAGYVLSTNGSGTLSWAAAGGGETPNVISITSATSAYATANGSISTNRLTGKYNALSVGSPFYWNYTNVNSACTLPTLTDSINLGALSKTLTGSPNVEMALYSTWGSAEPGIGFTAGRQQDISLGVVGITPSANAYITTGMIVGYPSVGPRIAIQLANILHTGSEDPVANSAANLINYIASDHSMIGNVVMGSNGSVVYLPAKSGADPVSERAGAMYYNTTYATIRVRLAAGVWANVVTSA